MNPAHLLLLLLTVESVRVVLAAWQRPRVCALWWRLQVLLDS
jgi:hypothetical protein